MWHNYLTVGVRALAKNRTYAAINIVGLAVGLAACLLILLFVREQLSFDRFVPDANRVYQLQSATTDSETGAVDPMQMSPYASGVALKKDFPQIELGAYATNTQPVILDKGQPRQLTITRVGADFFRIFAIPFLRGNPATALTDVNSVAISHKTAISLFGTDDAIGRTITVQDRDATRDMRVSAVFATFPLNSHMRAGMIALIDPNSMTTGQDHHWSWFSGYNYVKLRPGADVAAINAQLDAWKDRNAPREMIGGKLQSQVDHTRFTLVSLPDIHLGEGKGGPAGNEMDRGTIVTFVVLAVLILLMACFNFTNLATARASQRAREVALRKVLGASRGQLVTQFLVESVLVAGIAMLAALAIVELALPWFRRLLRADLPMPYIGHDSVLLPTLGLVLLVGIAGGLYPAFYLTRFQPARVLKANKSATEAEGSGRLRGALVVLQFAISIGLIVCTSVVYAQTVFARSSDPGFRRQGLVQVYGAGRTIVAPVIPTLQQEFSRVPGVRGVSRTAIAMNTHSRSNTSVILPGRAPLILGSYSVDYGFFETMGMTLLAGRTFSRDHPMDDATIADARDDARERALVQRGTNVVINESSMRQMGFSSPQAAIGKQVRIGFVDSENGDVPSTIVGVVGDTRFRSAREPAEDMFFFHNENALQYFVIRIDDPDPAAAMKRLEAVWKRVVPTVPFDAQFSQDAADELYEADEAVGMAFAGFAILSVVIGCLGLFGLAAFTAERRTKEIGIRKVLGARTRDIVQLLIWQFSRPVLLANLIAWPAAWWIMRDWLNGFDARIALTPVPFVEAGLLAMAIAVGTISAHAWRVARTSPIVALRYE